MRHNYVDRLWERIYGYGLHLVIALAQRASEQYDQSFRLNSVTFHAKEGAKNG